MKITAILSLLLLSSSVFASVNPIEGDYSTPAMVRMFNYTLEDCTAESGTFEASEETCYIPAENTIVIKKSEGRTTVDVSVIYGPANMRDFSGIVTKVKGHSLTVKEVELSEDGVKGDLVKGGCSLSAKVVNNQVTLTLGKTCDANLMRASGALKK